MGVGHPHNNLTMSRITLTLDAPLAKALRDEAQRDDRPISSVARKAFANYFKLTPAKRKKKEATK